MPKDQKSKFHLKQWFLNEEPKIFTIFMVSIKNQPLLADFRDHPCQASEMLSEIQSYASISIEKNYI